MKIKVNSCTLIKNQWIANVDEHNLYIDGKGGQNGDQGYIGETKFLRVIDEHSLVVENKIENGEYEYSVDNSNVFDIAVQHTSQHLFSAIAYNDYSLNTVGFRMTDTYTTVDLDRNDLDEKFVQELEDKVNAAIGEGKDIIIQTLSRDEANKIETFRKKISDKVVGDVRVVSIENLDTSACAGYHVDNIKDIRVFKIINFEKIKGNYTRFYFLAGERALSDYVLKNNITKELNKIFSCRDNEILDMVDKFNNERKNLESELRDITNLYSETIAKSLMETPVVINDKKYIIYHGKQEVVNSISKYLDENINFIGVWENGGVITGKDINCGEFVKTLSKNYNIKGGGKVDRANFKGTIAIDEITKLL